MEFRRRTEENLLGEKAELEREVAQKRDAVARLAAVLSEEQQRLRLLFGRRADPDEIRQARAYLEVLGGRRRLAEEELGEAEERLADCIERLIEARKARRTLERLRDRRWQEYQERSLAELQKELDESGAVRWLRGNGVDYAVGPAGSAAGRRSGTADA